MCYTIDIAFDSLVLMDEDGNIADDKPLAGYADAKHQVDRWAVAHAIDIAEAYAYLERHFGTRDESR